MFVIFIITSQLFGVQRERTACLKYNRKSTLQETVLVYLYMKTYVLLEAVVFPNQLFRVLGNSPTNPKLYSISLYIAN